MKHVQSCGEVMAVQEHANYAQVKNCLAGVRALCNECASWPGCPLASKKTHGQRNNE
jgi:hypothetical protein